MNMLFLLLTWWSWGILFSCIPSNNAYCSNDEDLQHHRCTCSLIHSYIQCSSLPQQCRTCYRYKTIFFDEHVNVLSAESFRHYDLFDYDSNRSFTIQFAQLQTISSNAFSKIDLDQNRTLSIKIGQYSSTKIPTRMFDTIEMQPKSTIDFEIFNVTSSLLIIEPYAFNGIKHGFQSVFRFAILSMKHTIEFPANAGSFFIPSYSTMEFYFTNFIHASLQDHSFTHITQAHSSRLQINFDHFQSASIGSGSFNEFHQLDESQFHLIFSNFRDLTIAPMLFHGVTQLKSSMIFSLYNMTNDLCLPSETFSLLKQDYNSTFQFEVDYGRTILFTSHTFRNITQLVQSKFSIIIRNSLDVYFTQQALKNIHQQEQSLLDIWIKYGRDLIFEENSIDNIDIQRSSMMRIGYQYSTGMLHMDVNAFVHLKEGQGGELLFQIMNSSDFYLRFNQTMTLDRLEIVDRIFIDEDLCRIGDIPAHLPVKLLQDNPCSCAVFYLYRRLRHTLNPAVLKEFTPVCYFNLPLDQIEQEEKKCSFNEQIHRCRPKPRQTNIQNPTGQCSNKSLSRLHNPHRSSSFLSFTALFSCVIFGLICLYLLTRCKTPLSLWGILKQSSWYSCCQKLPLFTADSYQQLTHMNETTLPDDFHPEKTSNKMRQIVMKYDSTSEQIQPYLHTNTSDFIVFNQTDNGDMILKLNTNPLDAMDDNP